MPITIHTGKSSSGSAYSGATIDSFGSAVINGVTGANQTIVAAPGANKQIWVIGYHITVSAAGTVNWEDGDGTSFTGAMPLSAGIALMPTSAENPVPLYKCATNTALRVDVVTATIYGNVQYVIVSV